MMSSSMMVMSSFSLGGEKCGIIMNQCVDQCASPDPNRIITALSVGLCMVGEGREGKGREGKKRGREGWRERKEERGWLGWLSCGELGCVHD